MPFPIATLCSLVLLAVGSAIEASAYQSLPSPLATRSALFRPLVPRGNAYTDVQQQSNRNRRSIVRSSAASDAIALTPNGERNNNVGKPQLNKLQSTLTKVGLLLFVVGMCLALPVALLPPFLAEKFGFINRLRREQYALRSGCFCSRWLMRLIPFANISVVPYLEDDPEPSVWACNHTSMLDIFVLLATDKKLRGKNRRPIKIVYWKGLEENPITKLLFTQCGMIPVEMADNGNGNANDYDKGSFKRLLKDMKAAFADGFDIGILPEGQLNPAPEKGLLPVFGGAFTLARMSRRRVRMMALHGVNNLWHPHESIGMAPSQRDVQVRAYPPCKPFESSEEFVTVFKKVVGHFGAVGDDLDDLEQWLDGTRWLEVQAKQAEIEKLEKDLTRGD
mmetsp:Transcript_4976/g.14132  ORF Transcript_4976/g.14132 Transcript_4976/m.14132 type:complete len:392 (+) Transcript_4976:2168-3343(+)|eukprot:CAMPEP_0181039010 /NCGR_PEP_ID=MMETSP1070-20121207/10233_1 /TAXON_ID=265543 /ORGANISM="Minutocellus polymorphus, Strain NH13" /LENGTH=391 /DNA_ID=CAMNT_0023116817 /DNA_START=2158 /DNA_END=3333 /DNA_ORIENTATION=-